MSTDRANLNAERITRSGVKRKNPESSKTSGSRSSDLKDEKSPVTMKTPAKSSSKNAPAKSEQKQKLKAQVDIKSEGKAKDPSEKPQLNVPEIQIPVKGELIKRIQGPSPWGNGTIHYTNKMYLGAHISTAG